MLCVSLIPTYAESRKVSVSIATDVLQLADVTVSVEDVDGDGIISLSDAIYAAHKEYCPNGVDGYSYIINDYGKTLTSVWDSTKSYSYGYAHNNGSAWTLDDEVFDGDSVYVYAYNDTVAWSDTYCYFDVTSVKVNEGESIKISLTGSGYDENWNLVYAPMAGAEITVDGEKTGIFTDGDGAVTLTGIKAGKHVISAVKENYYLVPPVCNATVNQTVAPATADFECLFFGLAVVSATMLAYLFISNRKNS